MPMLIPAARSADRFPFARSLATIRRTTAHLYAAVLAEIFTAWEVNPAIWRN